MHIVVLLTFLVPGLQIVCFPPSISAVDMGDIGACPLPASVNPVSCTVKDIIYVMLTPVLSYDPLKLLYSCLQENKPLLGSCYVISDYIYICI